MPKREENFGVWIDEGYWLDTERAREIMALLPKANPIVACATVKSSHGEDTFPVDPQKSAV